MATFSVHQWTDLDAGLAELRRVTRGPVVIFGGDAAKLDVFWLNDYAPEVIATEARRYPSIDRIAQGLGGTVDVITVEVPFDCADGFNQAYYGRPEALLDPRARRAKSAWGCSPRWSCGSFGTCSTTSTRESGIASTACAPSRISTARCDSSSAVRRASPAWARGCRPARARRAMRADVRRPGRGQLPRVHP
ncbi:MAG: hypothetical protein QOF79_3074 [Actinomycetota bacterium]|nr:hypothetical protein [Actinomycetota bacterium]